MKKSIIMSIITSLLVATFYFQSAIAWEKTGSSLTIRPQEIMIGALYHGENVSVIADFPRGTEVALSCEGPEETLTLMRKGKVFGLWMNVEEIVLHNVPPLYFLVTSKNLEEVYDRDTSGDSGLGYEALCSRARMEKTEEEKARLFSEFVKLKESDKLYSVSEGTLKITHLENRAQIVTTFHLPPKAPPGEYRINLYGLKDSGVDLLNNQAFVVKKVGLTAYLSSMAINHGLAYGVIAVIIAIISGLAVGIIFSSKGSH